MKYRQCHWSPAYESPPPPFLSGKDFNRYISIDCLSDDEKKNLWRGIKTKEPAMAEVMIDKTFNDFKKYFGAEQMIDQETYNTLYFGECND